MLSSSSLPSSGAGSIPASVLTWLTESLQAAEERDPVDVLNEAEWLVESMWTRLSPFSAPAVGMEEDSALLHLTQSRWLRHFTQRALEMSPSESFLAAAMLMKHQQRVVKALFSTQMGSR